MPGKESAPIVALTANAMEGDKKKYLEEGFDDYMAKPLTLKSLQSTLAKWFPD